MCWKVIKKSAALAIAFTVSEYIRHLSSPFAGQYAQGIGLFDAAPEQGEMGNPDRMSCVKKPNNLG
jgi:hypothetical protein